jgi:hypothetical protein
MAIQKPDFFDQSLPAQFSGIFDWDSLDRWSLPKFSTVGFMDIDAVLEKNSRFLHIETKSKGSKIPAGQTITIRSYHQLGCITYIFIYFDGETKDEKHIYKVTVMYPNDVDPHIVTKETDDYNERFRILCRIVREWYRDAENLGPLSLRADLQKPKEAPIVVPIIVKETFLQKLFKFFNL